MTHERTRGAEPGEPEPHQRPGVELPVVPGGPGGEVILPEHHPEGTETPAPPLTPLPEPDQPVPGPELPHVGIPGSPEVPVPPGHRPAVLT